MPPTTTSKNLGLISILKIGPTEPSNKQLLWLDTNFIPPKKKGFDQLTQQWVEVAFVASPANTLKKLIIDDIYDVDTNNVSLDQEDMHIKSASDASDTFINLPTPTSNYMGKTFELVNLSADKYIYFNFPILSHSGITIERQKPKTSYKIVCANTDNGVFKWVLVNSCYLIAEN